MAYHGGVDAPPRLLENLKVPRTMNGGGATSVVDVQDVLANTQSTIQPLIRYLDRQCWLFMAMALIGIGVTIYARRHDWRNGRC